MRASILAVGLLSVLATSVWAQNQFPSPLRPTINIQKAIELAEATTQGKAYEVDFDVRHHGIYWEIETRNAQGLKTEVIIDARTGKILPVRYD